MKGTSYIQWFEDISIDDVPMVGGKNASLGEMTRQLQAQGVRVPPGFATTAAAFWDFLKENGLALSSGGTSPLQKILESYRTGAVSLKETGAEIRNRLRDAQLPARLVEELSQAYVALSKRCEVERM